MFATLTVGFLLNVLGFFFQTPVPLEMGDYMDAATGAFTSIIPGSTILVIGGAGLMLALAVKFGRRILAIFR